MRTASILARLEIPTPKTHKKGKFEVSAFDIPPFHSWSPIDMDGLIDSEWGVMLDDGQEPAVWPIDCSFALPASDGNGLLIRMVRSENMRALRGRSRLISKFVSYDVGVDIDRYGNFINAGDGWFCRMGGKWVNAEVGGAFGHRVRGSPESRAPTVAVGIALRQRYEWSAIFSFPSGLKLRFGCSAEGCLKLFRDRDLPPDEGRRKALLHWVARHWRKTSDPHISRMVREHLRGVTKIQWRGQEVSIVPAEFELERAIVSAAIDDIANCRLAKRTY